MTRTYIDVGWRSVAGARHRSEGRENEDAVVITTSHPMLDAILLVADGMGGHPMPRQASEAATEAASAFLEPVEFTPVPDEAPALLREAVAVAHDRVTRLVPAGQNGKPPGTTLSLALVADGWLHVANVGDGSAFLCRSGRVRRLVGGEARRIGSRPENFIGSPEQPVVEEMSISLEEGDRVVLCSDGLTRYFAGHEGESQLGAILARRDADASAIASQLTAHSRGEEYDDDTSVVVADVTELRTVENRARLPASRDVAPANSVHPAVLILAGAVLGAAILAAGFIAGRSAVSPGPAARTGTIVPAPSPDPSGLSRLPRGNVVLLDEAGRQVYLLRTLPPGPRTAGPLSLRALRVRPDGRLDTLSGAFTIDAAGRTLKDPEGRVYPVRMDPSTGVVNLLPSGILVVQSPTPGLRGAIDGREVGVLPRRETVTPGRHTVRVWNAQWSTETEVDVPADRAIAVTLGPK